MVVEIRLFGALKKYAKSGVVALDLPGDCLVHQIREILKRRLADEFPDSFHGALVDRAALADHSRVLGNDEQLGQTHALALLPPVCGG